MWISQLILAALCVGMAFPQDPATSPAFEVASVKPVEPRPAVFRGAMSIDSARIDIRRMSLADLIRTGYEVKAYQVSGPDWISVERFDIVAKIPDGSTKEQVPAMLKTLLADRFKLKTHVENREYPVYVLIAGKNGPKLKAATPDLDRSTNSPAVKTSSSGNDVVHMEFSKTTMSALAEVLERFTDRPVIDETGLTGDYQAELDISQQELRMRQGWVPPPGWEPSEPGGGLFAAVQRLGLKLEAKKEPVKTIVVDRIERTPRGN